VAEREQRLAPVAVEGAVADEQRSVRSSILTSTDIRSVSESLQMKCLTVAPTPWLCRPRT